MRNLYCDNGTNFVGANNILKLESENAIKEFNSSVSSALATINTTFHFNPALSPWMGGIWERGVGSIKYHSILTYEELSTVLTQIEAVLNSRPLTPLSKNPDELDVLTPGHFLVGSALTAPIEPCLMHEKLNRLDRWETCTRMKQEFWHKWTNDFISQLQIRSKWTTKSENIKVGDLVLLKEENTAPMHWPLGRVKKVFLGKDNLVRAVEVMTSNKVYKRPVLKLAPMQMDSSTNDIPKPIDPKKITKNYEVSVSFLRGHISKGAARVL